MSRLLTVVVVTLMAWVAMTMPAEARTCKTQECRQNKIERAGFPMCNTWACVKRVKAAREKRQLKAERREMKRYRKNPLPWCTWGPESGANRPPFSMLRYRQPNISGGDGGGKFQILISTWYNFGGGRYASNPVYAKPVHQERVARKIAADGLHHWVNC